MGKITSQNERLLETIKVIQSRGWSVERISICSKDIESGEKAENQWHAYSKKNAPKILENNKPRENEWWAILCQNGLSLIHIRTAPPWLNDSEAEIWMGFKYGAFDGEISKLIKSKDYNLRDEEIRLHEIWEAYMQNPNDNFDQLKKCFDAKQAAELIGDAYAASSHLASNEKDIDTIIDALTKAYKAGRLAQMHDAAWMSSIARDGFSMVSNRKGRKFGDKNKYPKWKDEIISLWKSAHNHNPYSFLDDLCERGIAQPGTGKDAGKYRLGEQGNFIKADSATRKIRAWAKGE